MSGSILNPATSTPSTILWTRDNAPKVEVKFSSDIDDNAPPVKR